MKLTSAEESLLLLALRIAAAQWEQDANNNALPVRMREHFRSQFRRAIQLADTIEKEGI